MRANGPQATTEPGSDVRSAIAQWHLALRTELKRSSSLPTAMFDACDPMLEARLAETAKAMLACLQQPDTAVAAPPPIATEKRIEHVSPDELKDLPRRIATGSWPNLDLDTGLLAEYLAVLTDTCCGATGKARNGAVQLLCRDFGLAAATDLQHAAGLLWGCVKDSVAASETAATTTDQALADLCQRIAATVALQRTSDARGGGPA